MTHCVKCRWLAGSGACRVSALSGVDIPGASVSHCPAYAPRHITPAQRQSRTATLEWATQLERAQRHHAEALAKLRAGCRHAESIACYGIVLCPTCGDSWGQEDPDAPEALAVDQQHFAEVNAVAPRSRCCC